MSVTVAVDVEGLKEPCHLQIQGPQKISEVVDGLMKQHVVNGGIHRSRPVSYGLYWAEKKKWLDDNSSVQDNEMGGETALELRPRERIARIKLLNGLSKMLWIDFSKPVRGVVSQLCDQLGITCAEEMSLVVAGEYSTNGRSPGVTLSDTENRFFPSQARQLLGSAGQLSLDAPSPPASPKSPSQRRRVLTVDIGNKSPKLSPRSPNSLTPRSPNSLTRAFSRKKTPSPPYLLKRSWSPSFFFRRQSKLKKQISRRHQLRLDTPWLDPSKTLMEQDVNEDDELMLIFRFFYNMTLTRGSQEVDMLYSQAKAAFLNGELACSRPVMCKFAALELQIWQGNYNEQVTPEYLTSMKKSVVPKKAGIKEFAVQILTEYQQLTDVEVNEAKALFVQLWSTLPAFGMEFMSCADLTSKRKGLIGISKDKIVFMHRDTKQLTLSWPFMSLTKWSHDPEKCIVVLTFPSTELRVLVPDYSDVLTDCLSEHKRLQGVFSSETDIFDMAPHYTILTDSGLPMEKFAEAFVTQETSGLSFQDVFWAADITNPLVSSEELEEMKRGGWDNPAFSAVEEIVEDRFAFLDQALENCLDSDDN